MERLQPKVELKDILEAPNLQLLKDTFGVSETDLIIAYGNFIYAPNKSISRDLMIHELVHCERQGFNENSARRWWERYMEDNDFRLQEEVLAYHQQYLFCCRVFKDRNKQDKILRAMAHELSSPRYGSIVVNSDALRLVSGKMV